MTTNLSNALRAVFREATIAQPVRAHTPPGFQEPTAYLPASMARSLPACLKTSNLPALFRKDGSLMRTPRGAPAGTSLTMDKAIISSSRVAAAGANVLVLDDNRQAHAVGKTNDVAMQSVPVQLRTIAAAEFVAVDIDAEQDVALAPLPVQVANLHWAGAITKGVRFSATRSDLRGIGDQEFCDEVSIALTLGIARAADETLLATIAGQSLSPFSLASAAAAGVSLGELRALVGTTGAGAALGHDGKLRVTSMPTLPAEATPDTAALVAATLAGSGVPGEITPDMAGTIVGAWDRSAIAIRDDIDIHFKRVGLSGGVEVIAWINLLPLVTDAGKFWTVAA